MDILSGKERNMYVSSMDVIFHGCEKCFPRNREIIMNNHRSMAQRYRDTKLKEKSLERDGYFVLTKWSCEFAEEKKKPEV